MGQRILGSHTPPCHRRMVITTLSSTSCLAAPQRKPDQSRMSPCMRHSRWLSKALWLSGSARSHHPPTAPVSLKPLAPWASLSLCFFLFALPWGYVCLTPRPPKGVSLPLYPPHKFLSVPLFPLFLPRLTPSLCLPVQLRRTTVRTAACSATCRATLQRPL